VGFEPTHAPLFSASYTLLCKDLARFQLESLVGRRIRIPPASCSLALQNNIILKPTTKARSTGLFLWRPAALLWRCRRGLWLSWPAPRPAGADHVAVQVQAVDHVLPVAFSRPVGRVFKGGQIASPNGSNKGISRPAGYFGRLGQGNSLADNLSARPQVGEGHPEAGRVNLGYLEQFGNLAGGQVFRHVQD